MNKNSKICKQSKQKFKHLSIEDRTEIFAGIILQKSARQIAKDINRHPSTVVRELKRNTPRIRKGYYRPHIAQKRYECRKSGAHQRKRLKNSFIRKFVTKKLKEFWSPLLIAGRLYKYYPDNRVSHETIYQFVYKERPDLIKFLYFRHRIRKKRGQKKSHRQSHIKNRVLIDQRPESIAKRDRFGHWEADTVISRESKYSLAILTERKARFLMMQKIKRCASVNFRDALIKSLKRVPKCLRKSITYDNGKENTLHQEINRKFKMKSYFCNPYRSYEKGTVERIIRDIRRFLPKKTNFANVSQRTIKRILKILNNRPRKCLNYKTPAESLAEKGVAVKN